MEIFFTESISKVLTEIKGLRDWLFRLRKRSGSKLELFYDNILELEYLKITFQYDYFIGALCDEKYLY